jgi:hypothetical protein
VASGVTVSDLTPEKKDQAVHSWYKVGCITAWRRGCLGLDDDAGRAHGSTALDRGTAALGAVRFRDNVTPE